MFPRLASGKGGIILVSDDEDESLAAFPLRSEKAPGSGKAPLSISQVMEQEIEEEEDSSRILESNTGDGGEEEEEADAKTKEGAASPLDATSLRSVEGCLPEERSVDATGAQVLAKIMKQLQQELGVPKAIDVPTSNLLIERVTATQRNLHVFQQDVRQASKKLIVVPPPLLDPVAVEAIPSATPDSSHRRIKRTASHYPFGHHDKRRQVVVTDSSEEGEEEEEEEKAEEVEKAAEAEEANEADGVLLKKCPLLRRLPLRKCQRLWRISL